MNKYKGKVIDLEEEQDKPALITPEITRCVNCNAFLTSKDKEFYTDLCEGCAWDETGGLIDDDPEQELDFDN